jgi:TRAP-type C4-dicarboxylate transport system substrate-binding protein
MGLVFFVIFLVTTTMTPAAMAKTKLTLSSWVPPTHFIVKDIIEPWAKGVEKATMGRVGIEILPKAVGSPAQHFELAVKGVADITWGNFSYEPERFKSIWFTEFPYAGENATASSVALWRTQRKFLADNVAYKGVVMLALGTLGPGSLHHGGHPVIGPEDIKGQKVRMGGPIQKRLIEGLEAIPIAAPATKAYELLQSGVIDASLHSIESIVNFRLEDQLKYHTKISEGLYGAAFFIVMNEKTWNRLSEVDQKAIMEVSGEKLSRQFGVIFDTQNKDAEAKLRAAGHVFSTPSKALLENIGEVRSAMLAEWFEQATSFGVSNPKAMIEYYENEYKAAVAN